jgi:hypothetical protein
VSEEQDQKEARAMLLETVRLFFERYESCVRGRKYELMQKLWHPNATCFGLCCNVASGRVQIENLEWRELWPSQLAFTFDMQSACIIPNGADTVVAILWSANGLLHGSPRQHGRATMMLAAVEKDQTICLHSHFSRNTQC